MSREPKSKVSIEPLPFANPMYERRTPDMSTWKGRGRKGFRCNNSFQEFVDNIFRTDRGKEHLERHHGGLSAARGKNRES